MKNSTTLAALALGVLVSACGGGGGAMTPNAPSGTASQGGKATLSITIPAAPAGQSQSRKYISAGTESVTIAQGATSLGTFNTTPSSPGCGQTPSGLTCTFSIAPAVGANQTFTVTAYQFQNAGGAVLSSGSTSVNVAANANTNIAISMGGQVASIGFVFPSVPAGTATSAPFSVAAKDSSGATIIGSTAFTAPITLSVAANGGVVALAVNGGTPGSQITLNSPSDMPSISYNGHNLGFASITATTTPPGGSTLTSTSYFGPAPTIVAQHVGPFSQGTNIRCCWGVGPDSVTGSFWYAIYDNNTSQYELAAISPTANVTIYGAGQIPNDIQGILPNGPGGKLWFTQSVTPLTTATLNLNTSAIAFLQDTNPATQSSNAYYVSAGTSTWSYVLSCCPSGNWATYFLDGTTGTTALAVSAYENPGPLVIGSNGYFASSNEILQQMAITGTSPNLAFGAPAFAAFGQPTVSNAVAAGDGTLWSAITCTFAHVTPGSPFSNTTASYFTIPTTQCNPTIIGGEARRAQTAGGGGLNGTVLVAPDNSLWAFGAGGYLAGMPGGATPANASYSTATFPLVSAGGATLPFQPSNWGFAPDGNIIAHGNINGNTVNMQVYTVEIAY